METAPSEAFEGAAEEIVEVDNDEKEIVGNLDAPNKDTNTIWPIRSKREQSETCTNLNLLEECKYYGDLKGQANPN